MKLVLYRRDLIKHSSDVHIDLICLNDFRWPIRCKSKFAHKILFKDKNRTRILKDRWPTEWSFKKKRIKL